MAIGVITLVLLLVSIINITSCDAVVHANGGNLLSHN
jgi:hypothetical protein